MTAKRKPLTLLLIRHAQSEFNRHYNATGEDPGIVDPRITEMGRDQARRAAAIVARHRVHTVIASPFTRALETAAAIAGHHPGVLLLVEPLVRERGAFSCDIGRPRSSLAPSWPQFDFGALPETWWDQSIESTAAIARRASAFRVKAAEMEDHEGVAVVSHWGFILQLTGHAVENARILRFDPSGRYETVAIG